MTSLLRWAALVAITAHGLWVMPGRAYLISDTQIYSPMLDRLADPSLYNREIVAQRQHLSLTIWDETVLGIQRITGVPHEHVLDALQAISRLIGLYGLFLIGTALGLSEAAALLIPAIVGLGAFVHGPAVVTIEYEAVPRGIAGMLSFLAIGLAMGGNHRGAMIAAGIGFLFHAPVVIPFLAAFALFQAWQRDLKPLAWLAIFVAVTAILNRLQPGVVEKQSFFTLVDPAWEELQRMRAGYNWLSSWKPWMFRNFLFNGAIAALALWRIWKHLSVRARFYSVMLPLIGLLSLPLAWLVMEQWKWALMAQVQPARAVLFTLVFGLLLTIAASVYAARSGKWIESAAWLVPSVFTAFHGYLWEQFGLPARDLQVTAAVVLWVLLAMSCERRSQAAAVFFAVGTAVLAGWLWKDVLKKSNFVQPENPELTSAALWAKQNSPKDAMFLLPELARSSESGVFRVRAQRALYVDWKIGGQVNYSRDLSFEWWRRMKLADDKKRPLDSWKSEGVDYLVLKSGTAFPAGREVYRNSRYAIYSLTTP